MESVTLEQLVSGIGIVVAIITPIFTIYKVYTKCIGDRFRKIEKSVEEYRYDIEKLKKESNMNKKENLLLIKSIQACLKGLKEQGCNGPVTEAIKNIDEYLLKASHD